MKGLGAISGVALKLLFMDASRSDKMEIFDDYLQRRMAVIQAFLAQMNSRDEAFTQACETLEIKPEIVPFMIDDEQAQVNLLMSATGQKAIVSRKTAVQQLGWVNDTEAELEQIEAEENRTPGEPFDTFKQQVNRPRSAGAGRQQSTGRMETKEKFINRLKHQDNGQGNYNANNQQRQPST